MSEYPFPPDERAPVDLNDETATAYERTVLTIFREHLVGRWAPAPREVLSVHLSGRKPDTMLVIRYRDQLTETDRTVRWWVWEAVDPATVEQGYEPPHSLLANFAALWASGQIEPEP